MKVLKTIGEKVALTMKEVDQRTGEDLRPRRANLGTDDLRANPSRPANEPMNRNLIRETQDGRQGKRVSSPERWEMTQLIGSGVLKNTGKLTAAHSFFLFLFLRRDGERERERRE